MWKNNHNKNIFKLLLTSCVNIINICYINYIIFLINHLFLSFSLSFFYLPDVKQVWVFLYTLYAWWIIANEKFLEKQSSSESVLHRLAIDQSPKLLWPIRNAQCNGKFRSPRKVAAMTPTYLHVFHARKRKCET